MLSPAENELLCRVEGDAPGGKAVRRYWLPALLSEEVAEPGGAPARLRLVGKNYIAFRNTDGELAVLDARCPHRGASLGLARNEENGLRCIYHGWKFDKSGQCVDMPTEPPGTSYAHRIKTGSYPVHESGGLVWVYLGPPDLQPPFPAMDWTMLPQSHVARLKFIEKCNWVQATEGAIDTAHTWFLHRGDVPDWKHRMSLTQDFSPRLEAEDTPYGYRYASIRIPTEDPENLRYVRVTNVIFPSTVLVPRPIGDKYTTLNPTVQIFIPMDDYNTMHYTLFFNPYEPVDETAIRDYFGCLPGRDIDPVTFELDKVESNWWKQDRVSMKGEDGSYTGIQGIMSQDVACQESMGEISDRTTEHLGTSDIAIVRMRRRFLENIRDIAAGALPIGNDPSIDYPHLRSEQRLIPATQPWQSVGAFAGEFTPAGRS
jgi:phthalate 4,5-dioxygenase oxygenase subunit